MTYNLENVTVEKVKKEIKLISFEEILSTPSLKQGVAKDDIKTVLEQIKLENNGGNFVNFQRNEKNKKNLKEEIIKFNENRVVSHKNLQFIMSQETDKLSNSSQYSNKLSEKMVENMRINQNEIASQKSEASNKKITENDRTNDQAINNLEQKKPTPVISLVKFLKKQVPERFNLILIFVCKLLLF